MEPLFVQMYTSMPVDDQKGPELLRLKLLKMPATLSNNLMDTTGKADL